MFRIVPRIFIGRATIAPIRSIYPRVLTKTPRLSGANVGVRWASTSPGEDEKLKEIIQKLQADPEIVQILRDFQNLLVEKGFDPVKPSMMQMMRLFAQSDVREQATKLKNKLDEAGINLSPEHISLFMKNFKN